MVAGVWSNDSNLQLEATTQFRKLLSIGKVGNLCCFHCVIHVLLRDRLLFILYTSLQSEAPLLRKSYNLELFLALLSFL